MLSTGNENPVIENDSIPMSEAMLAANLRLGIRQHMKTANACVAITKRIIARIIIRGLQYNGKWL